MKKTSRSQRKQTVPAAVIQQPAMVEICRSFAYKLNIPGAFESRDFFCSWKGQGAPSQAEEISREAYKFCEAEVLQSVKQYRQKRAAQLGEDAA
jgi:hypothetical protein